MPQRTLAQARQVLDDNKHLIAPTQWKEYDAELQEATRAATAAAMGSFDKKYSEALGVCHETGKGLCEVRDSARALTADLAAGRITAREGTQRWNELREQARRLAANNDRVHEQAERLAAMEAEPAEWFDDLCTRMPKAQPNFSF